MSGGVCVAVVIVVWWCDEDLDPLVDLLHWLHRMCGLAYNAERKLPARPPS